MGRKPSGIPSRTRSVPAFLPHRADLRISLFRLKSAPMASHTLSERSMDDRISSTCAAITRLHARLDSGSSSPPKGCGRLQRERVRMSQRTRPSRTRNPDMVHRVCVLHYTLWNLHWISSQNYILMRAPTRLSQYRRRITANTNSVRRR
jgi:hypothetical protein